MRVLLLKPYQRVPGLVYAPPLGLLYLTAELRERFGTQVDITVIDMKSRHLPPEWLKGRLDELRPDVVGVSALNCEAQASRQIATIVKAHNEKTLTVLGGPYAHRRGEELLGRTEFDWVVGGPADRVFPEALERVFNGGELGTDLPGISYRKPDGSFHVSAENDSFKTLDFLPLPAWDLVDFDLYARLPNQMTMLKGRRYATIFTSRGCPYKCNYCHDLFGKRFRYRSPENVLTEIELLYEKYGVDEFEIVDDIFNLHKPRLKAIMSEAQRRWPGRIHFCFPNGVRADLIDDSVLDALKAGGTYAMAIAVETVTPRLQELVEKHLDIDKTLRVINGADERGIMVSGFFMVGFPTETPEEIEATIDFALKSRLSIASFFNVIPQPETPLYELAKKENVEALRASDADEEEGTAYRSLHPWYQRAYGYDLARKVRSANMRFFLRPRRLMRIASRVPLSSYYMTGREFARAFLTRQMAHLVRPE